MIEQGIYFALGCIVTALCALMFAPAFWSRAMRLSRKRLQLQIPVSMQEIYAERDGLRAEFAVERLRVEQALQRVEDGKAADMAEIGRRTVEVSRLAEELAAVKAELLSLRERYYAVDAERVGAQAAVSAAAVDAAALRTDLAAAQSQGALARSELTARYADLVAARADAAGARAAAEEALARHGAEMAALHEEQARFRMMEDELAASRDREKSLHLQNSMKAEKGRATGERLEQLEGENAMLRAALDEARTASAAGDAGLRESIHALGLAVAAMSTEETRPRIAAGERNPAE